MNMRERAEDWSLTLGFTLVLESQSEPEKWSVARTGSHCPDREETLLLGTVFSWATHVA